jgi:hypothetical protein
VKAVSRTHQVELVSQPAATVNQSLLKVFKSIEAAVEKWKIGQRPEMFSCLEFGGTGGRKSRSLKGGSKTFDEVCQAALSTTSEMWRERDGCTNSEKAWRAALKATMETSGMRSQNERPELDTVREIV